MTEHNPIKVPEPRFGAWLMEPIRRNRSVYLKVALAAVMINIFGMVTSLFTMTVYDRVVPNNATSSLVALSIGLVVIVVFDFILKLLRAYFVDIAGASIDREVGETLFQRLLKLRLDLKKGSTGSLTGIMRELEALRDFFTSATMTARSAGSAETAWSHPSSALSVVKCFSITRAPSMYATGAIAMPSWWSESPITSSG